MPEQNPNPEEQKTQPRMRLSSIVTFIFLSTAAIVIAYIWGVMAGRSGYVPEAAKNEAMLPETRIDAPPSKNATHAILSPEELDYARVLRNEKARERVKETRTPEPPKEMPAAGVAQNVVPGSPVESKAQNEEKSADKEAMFDYVFQLGAFKDEDTVDALRQKLEGRGLRTRMQKDGKLYLVFVLLRGTAERAAEVTAIARDLRLGEPIVRGKKPVPPQG